MTQDAQMNDTATQQSPSNSLSLTVSPVLQHLKEIASLMEAGAYTKDNRRIHRGLRATFTVRRKLTASALAFFLDYALTPGSRTHTTLMMLLPKIGWAPRRSRVSLIEISIVSEGHENEMEVDTALSPAPTQSKITPPALEMLCYLLVLLFLIDKKMYKEAKACASASITRLKSLKRRVADVLACKVYSYYSLSYELTGSLAEIRGELLALHCLATSHHDELGQETLFNLLLRNYLHYSLYDQSEKLRTKAPGFGAHSNHQHCRYLFYVGKIQTIQLEYTDAKGSLLQAARAAPVRARGFRIQCNKWAVVVRLLLGEIPERTTFMQKGVEDALQPYCELTNAVRIGDLEEFRRIAEKFSETFNKDRTHNLIIRLRHNVIRTGLINISMSYSCISLVDVAKKLRLDSTNSVADAESIVAKAIRDGAIDATLDHTNGWMLPKETSDIYSTTEPQVAFDSRIAFCLNMHNEAVRALRYLRDSHMEKESAEKRRKGKAAARART